MTLRALGASGMLVLVACSGVEILPPLPGSGFEVGVVGDTRPPSIDDTAHYPTFIITQIWADLATSGASLVLGTGDYQYASATSTDADAQIDLYMAARAQYDGPFYPALGNHECNGETTSNCGSGNRDGVTSSFAAFQTKMLAPIQQSQPYYSVRFDAADGTYTAKLIVIAANAWDAAQAAWLGEAIAVPTTYTFVLRHEASTVDAAPGVSPSEAILAGYPITLRVVGHEHTYEHRPETHEVVCGNGGAPLTTPVDYGYAIIERVTTGAVQLTEYDYRSDEVIDRFRVNADGSPAQ